MTSQIVPAVEKILFEGKMSWTIQNNEWEVQRKTQTNKIKKGELKGRTVFFSGMLKAFVILRRVFYIESL